MDYNVGDRVERIEDRDVTAATILSIQTMGEETVLEIQYDEGGSGWWPKKCIRPLQPVPELEPQPEPEPDPQPQPEPESA